MVVTVSRNTRQDVVAAAADLFRRQGFSATSVGQVAEEAGISKGNLTYHFPSKQALWEEVNHQAMAYVRDRIVARSFAEAADTIGAVEAYAERVRRHFVDKEGRFVGCLFTNIAIETRHSDPQVAALARASLDSFKAMVVAKLSQGQERGEIRADQGAKGLADAFFWMFEGALTLSRAQGDPIEYDAFRAYIRDFLRPVSPSGDSR
jgi:TetR/AcrR family transcriptional repressor of nem operon